MAKSKLSFFSGIVVPVLTIAATVALAFVWSGEGVKTPLFYVNLCYGVVLELIFFGYIAVVRSGRKEFTGAFYSVIGVWAGYYILCGTVLLALSQLMPLKLYITLIVVLTLLWLIVGALVAETDSRHKSDIEATEEKNKKLMKK